MLLSRHEIYNVRRKGRTYPIPGCVTLIYRDNETHEVNSVELTEPVFKFLKLLEKNTPEEAILKVDWSVDVEEVEAYLLGFVEELRKKGILSGP
ncbi:MAG: hypothetical protein Q9N34_04825 [Aquificota bacterium]|nr:hypothetical protein [Aquificota bacterium]